MELISKSRASASFLKNSSRPPSLHQRPKASMKSCIVYYLSTFDIGGQVLCMLEIINFYLSYVRKVAIGCITFEIKVIEKKENYKRRFLNTQYILKFGFVNLMVKSGFQNYKNMIEPI
jgi:hypothetical protein